jgi:peroxiredoxin Q/BCP
MKKFIAAAALAMSAVAAAGIAAPAFAALQNGATAPDFTAKGMLNGAAFNFKLSDALKKGPVVVYFFPAAYTEGCTVETIQFGEHADEFKANGATLIGVTTKARLADNTMGDAEANIPRLAEFSKQHCADKFPIGAINTATTQAYDVVLNASRADWSNRTSFVIAPDGKILLSHTDMKPESHIKETLATLKAHKAKHASGGGHH